MTHNIRNTYFHMLAIREVNNLNSKNGNWDKKISASIWNEYAKENNLAQIDENSNMDTDMALDIIKENLANKKNINQENNENKINTNRNKQNNTSKFGLN